MKKSEFYLLSVLLTGLAFSYAGAGGDGAKGKALFNDPELAGSTTEKSCNSCHPEGKGAAKAAGRKNVRETINHCIVNVLKGKALPLNSSQMDDLVAYLKSVKGKN